MKKFIAIIALLAAIFTVGTTTAEAQTRYEDFNYVLAKTHTTDYIQKGDDAYRMGHYNEAMDAYKRARSYNNYQGRTIVPAREIDHKLDRCAEAIRFGGRPAPARPARNERVSDAAAAVAGVAILGGLIAAATSHKKAAPAATPAVASEDMTLHEVTSNGLTYSTPSANANCSILSVTTESSYTVVEMEFINIERADKICINKDTYLKDRSTGRRFNLVDTENISTKNMTKIAQGDSHTFRLYFDRISDDCSEIDVIEPGTSSWKFYHVPTCNF